MRDAIASIENYSCGATGGVEREHGLDGCVERWDVEGFEEDLRSCVAITARIERRFGE